MLNDTTISSLYNCLNSNNHSTVEAKELHTDSTSSSTSIVTSTGESSTCNYDSVTIDENDSSYYTKIDITKEESLDDSKISINSDQEDSSRVCKACDNFIREIASLKEQIYYDWNKRVKPLEDSLFVKQEIIDCYKKETEFYKLEISKWKDKVIALDKELKSSQRLIGDYCNAVILKQKECDNTKILLESALTSLNIERDKNSNLISSKRLKRESNNVDTLPDIADRHNNSAGDDETLKPVRRYATRRATGALTTKSIDIDIFN